MKQIIGVIVTTLGGILANATCHAESTLHPVEVKWLAAAEPVLDFARVQGFPIDVIVQPRSTANDVPVAMGVRDQRCKLILSLRDKADAEESLQDAALEQHAILIEAMVAHEMAHCWRYMQGTWHTFPAGFVESQGGDVHELVARRREMRTTQREEGYADLIALAWTLQKHPDDYAMVHAWLERVRHDQPMVGSYHDTRVWLKLAKDPAAFPSGNTPFERVEAMWVTGLRSHR
jgi:hypothetical protein